jgi:hypothetical protein
MVYCLLLRLMCKKLNCEPDCIVKKDPCHWKLDHIIPLGDSRKPLVENTVSNLAKAIYKLFSPKFVLSTPPKDFPVLVEPKFYACLGSMGSPLHNPTRAAVVSGILNSSGIPRDLIELIDGYAKDSELNAQLEFLMNPKPTDPNCDILSEHKKEIRVALEQGNKYCF